MPKGKTILSCGHEDVDGCLGVSVQFEDEDCVAGEGFVPVTVYAQYCHDCAKTLHFGLGKDAGRAEQAAEIERLRERLEIDPAHSIDGIYARDETIRGLETELAKFKALAETLAGAVKALMPTHINLRMPHPDDSFIVPLDVNMGELRALDAALRKWEEARDAS